MYKALCLISRTEKKTKEKKKYLDSWTLHMQSLDSTTVSHYDKLSLRITACVFTLVFFLILKNIGGEGLLDAGLVYTLLRSQG
jgi:hypothetical protein